MNVNDYKASIKSMVDATNNAALLKQWHEQLERDVQHPEGMTLSEEEWILVQEGLADYKAGKVLSLEDFLAKR